MFTKSELSLFQSDYFSLFKYENKTIEVRSQNTGHWWQIYRMDMPITTMIVVKHRYPGVKKYHMQFHVHTAAKACRMIMDHDFYILKNILIE